MRWPAPGPRRPAGVAELPPSPAHALFQNPRSRAAWAGELHTKGVRRTVRHGHRLPFKDGRPPDPYWVRAYPREKKFEKGFAEERDRVIKQGSWVPCEVQDGKELMRRGCCISPSFCVERKDTHRPRIIYDGRRLNESVAKYSFKMEGLRMLPRLARRGFYACTLDIADHFMHVGIHRSHWRYMVLDLGAPPDGNTPTPANPQFVYLAVLPMGYTNSPAVIAQVMSGVVRQCRMAGIRLIQYADDWLVADATVEKTAAARKYAVTALTEHGFLVKPGKGEEKPVQQLVHLGLGLDLERGLFLVPPPKMNKLMREAKGLLCSSAQNRRWVSASWLQSFLGTCISVQLAVPTARFRTRACFDVLAQHGIYRRGRLSKHKVKLSRAARDDIRWWRDLERNSTGRAVWRPPVTVTAWTDASKEENSGGWGGEIKNLPGSRGQVVAAHGVWTKQELTHSINFLELRAVKNFLSIPHIARRLKGQSLLLWEDNMSVMHILNNLVSRSPTMMSELREVYDLLAKLDLRLRSRYIPSADNPADYWSRIWRDKADWQLRPALAHRWMHRWGSRTVDLFASRGTALLGRYGSAVPDPGAEFADAFAIPWTGERAWVNPPWSKILDILGKLDSEPGAEATLLLPAWPNQPWWPLLVELADAMEIVQLTKADVIPGPGCQQSGTVPEVLRNRGWKLVLCHIPARTQRSCL